MCMFIITGIIYCAEMMIAFKDESDEMIASYWRRIDAKSFDENRDLDGADEASVQRHAKRFFHTAHGILTAAAVFIVLALITSARVMGLKYTLKRVGTGVNFAGIVFGLFLLVMCGVVSRTTYHVSDAVTVDVEVTFAQVSEGPPSRAARDFEDTLRLEPERIFRDQQPPPPPGGSRGGGGLDPQMPPPPVSPMTPPPPLSPQMPPPLPPPQMPPPPGNSTPSGRRLLAAPNPPPPPPWSGDFPVTSMWLVAVDRTQPNPPVSTLIEFTISFSGMNASTDINATLPPAVESRCRRAIAALPTAPDPGDVDVEVMNMRKGGEHPIGGAWTAQLLAAAGAITVISSTAGFVGIQAGSRPMLSVHLAVSGVTAILVIVGVHHVTQHADDSKDYIRSHWKNIQTGVVGNNVEVDDAAAFANSHMRSAAALGAIVCTILFVSILCSTVALLVIPGGPLANVIGNRPRPGRARAARLPDTESDDDDDDSDEDGWGVEDRWDSWGGENDDTTPLRDDESNVQRRTKSQKRAKRDAKRALAARAAQNGAGGSGSTAAGPGQVVVEMSDLANLVQEARKGRGRFKDRGGKSSRTPSPTGHDVENPPSRESSPQRKARLQRERARKAKDSSVANTVSRLEDKLVDRMNALFGGIGTPKGAGGGGLEGGGGRGGTSVFRDEISKPHYSRADVAAAVNMLREAAQKRNPNDPEAALRAALDVAGEGDAGLIREALAAPFEVSKPHAGASFTLE